LDRVHAQALLNLIAELYLAASAPEPTQPDTAVNVNGLRQPEPEPTAAP
jgi:hypothetical protein